MIYDLCILRGELRKEHPNGFRLLIDVLDQLRVSYEGHIPITGV